MTREMRKIKKRKWENELRKGKENVGEKEIKYPIAFKFDF